MDCTASHSSYPPTNGVKAMDEPGEHHYDELFPPLSGSGSTASLSPMSSAASLSGTKQSPIGTPKRLPPRVSPAKTVQGAVGDGRMSKGSGTSAILVIPWEERRFPQVGMNGEGTQAAAQRRVCQDIITRTHVSIDLHMNKDRSLSISVTGKADAVQEARKILNRELVTQGQNKLDIPQEYHRFILGRKGEKLREIEQRTGTKINVPRPEEHSNEITIQGSKEALVAAQVELATIYQDQCRRAQDTLTIPKIYYPFLWGPYNRYLEDLRDRKAVKINVPPPSAASDQIVLMGEKESVAEVKRELEERLQTILKDCHTLTFTIPKAKHRYVIGVRAAGLHDILEQTGVSVEMPSFDDKNEEITLRGPQANLGRALSMMVERSHSMTQINIPAPAWLHRHLIGPKGATLAKFTGNREKLRVDFQEGTISIEGPTKDAEEVAQEIAREVKKLQDSITITELNNVNAAHHKHIVGRAGSNIERLQQEFEVNIKLDSMGTVRIEGPPQGVAQAKLNIETMLQKIENEKRKDLIIDHRFHRFIIGAQGSGVRELREHHPQVQINFPDASSKSNIVQLRGPRQDVDAVSQLLMAKYKEFANVEELVVDIPASLHAALIGSKGHVLHNIQAECGGGVQIKFPRLDKSNAGNGEINKSAAAGDKVIVRGPMEEAQKAKQLLLQLAKEKEALSFEDTLKCRPELHKFLIGKGGSSLHELRQATGARVILPSLASNEVCEELAPSTLPADVITIIGSKEAVAKAKDLLQKRIVELENTEERTMNVDPKWHRHFVQRRGQLLNSISQECGGVAISFPSRPEEGQETSDVVRVKGPSKCVEAAMIRLTEIVNELESHITIELNIPVKYHRALIGQSGQQVRDIQDQFKVNIRFPPAPNKTMGGTEFTADNAVNEDASNIIVISGSADNCELVKEALLQLVPVEETVPLLNEFHGSLVGAKGQQIQHLQRTHEVQIQVPEASLGEDSIVVKGKPDRVEKFKEALTSLLNGWEEEKKNRIASSFQLECFVPVSYHRKLIGARGARIQELIEKYSVVIMMPNTRSTTANNKQADNTPEENEDAEQPVVQQEPPPAGAASERIVIRGFEEKANAARQAILDRVEYLKKLVTVELSLPHEIHNRLIGQHGRNLRKLLEDFEVEEISFPTFETVDKDLVQVTGPQDKVDACSDHLVELANELMDQYEEKQMFAAARGPPPASTLMQRSQLNVKEVSNGRGKSGGFSVAGAPWQQPKQSTAESGTTFTGAMPDTNNCEEFPSIAGNAPTTLPQQVNGGHNGWADVGNRDASL